MEGDNLAYLSHYKLKAPLGSIPHVMRIGSHIPFYRPVTEEAINGFVKFANYIGLGATVRE